MGKICVNCGAQIEDDAVFCDECGAKQVVDQVKDEQVSVKMKDTKMENKKGEVEKKDNGIGSIILGSIFILAIGYAISFKYPVAFVISIVIVVLGIIGNIMDSKKG